MLSRRLEAILATVERWAAYQRHHEPAQDVVLADIGSDHALVPVHALCRHLVERVVAAEAARGPYERARSAVRDSSWARHIDLRLGSGLTVLEEGEAQLILVAGMGGRQIADIVASGCSVARLAGPGQSPPILILQPMSHQAELRRHLLTCGFGVGEERIVTEPSHFYHIVVARYPAEPTESPDWLGASDLHGLLHRRLGIDVNLVRGEPGPLSQALLELGPLNLLEPGQTALAYSELRCRQLEAALDEFARGGGTDREREQRLVGLVGAWRLLRDLEEADRVDKGG